MTAPVRTIGVKFEAQGVPEVQAALRQVQTSASNAAGVAMRTAASTASAATNMGERYAGAARHIAFATESMARMGEVGGAAAKNVIAQTSMMAMAFGPTGMIVGAIAVGSLAIYELFDGISERAKKSADDAIQAFNRIARGNSAGTRATIDQLYFGDPKVGPNASNEQLGMLRLMERSSTLQAQLNSPGGIGDFFSRRSSLTALRETEGAIDAIKKTVDGYSKELEKQRAAEARATEATRAQTAALEAQKKAIEASAAAAAAAARSAIDRQLLDFSAGARARSGVNPYSGQKNWTGSAAMGAAGNAALNAAGPKMQSGVPSLDQLDQDMAASMAALEAKAAEWGAQIRKTIQEVMAASYSDLSNIIAGGLTGAVAGGIMAAMTSGDIRSAAKLWGDEMIGVMAKSVANWAITAGAFSKAMATVQKFMTMHPLAAAAAAAALYLAARSLSRGGVSSGGSIGGSLSSFATSAAAGSDQVTRILWGADSAAVAAGMTPRQSNQFVIIGPADPQAQRAIRELINKDTRRG